MPLMRLMTEQVKLNEPLPWTVWDEAGHLLLAQGVVVRDPKQLAALRARGMYVEVEFDRVRRPRETRRVERPFEPFRAWADAQARLTTLLREHAGNPQFVPAFLQLAGEVRRLMARDADAGLFAMMHGELAQYPVQHALHVAIVAELVAARLAWHEAQRLSLCCAALSMNIAIRRLQGTLAVHPAPPSPSMREEIRAHPARGAIALREAGVSDPDWLRAVAEHHELPDGSGYPAGVTEISPLATVLRHADVFCAKVSPRASRRALLSSRAARELFLGHGGNGNPVAALIVKEVGIYPPGTRVRLANGEIAVVLRRGENAYTPLVAALASSSGVPYGRPIRRDTRRRDHAISGSAAPGVPRIELDPVLLYGFAAA